MSCPFAIVYDMTNFGLIIISIMQIILTNYVSSLIKIMERLSFRPDLHTIDSDVEEYYFRSVASFFSRL
jgi:hypothetical protein